MASFKVLRHMDGDKSYAPGDLRELSAADAEHLVASGAIEPVKAPSAAPAAATPRKPSPSKRGR